MQAHNKTNSLGPSKSRLILSPVICLSSPSHPLVFRQDTRVVVCQWLALISRGFNALASTSAKSGG